MNKQCIEVSSLFEVKRREEQEDYVVLSKEDWDMEKICI